MDNEPSWTSLFCRCKRLLQAALAFMLFAAPLVLSFGNPQWHYVVYRWQTEVFPGEWPERPDNYTGRWRSYWHTWEPMVEEPYVDGKLADGPFCRWYKDGRLEMEGHYSDGRISGTYREWYPDGTMKIDGYLAANGSPLANTRFYYPDGKVREEWLDGQSQGLVVVNEFRPNGQKSYTAGYDADRNMHGRFMRWFEDGQLAADWSYVHDCPSGVHRFWYRNGQLRGEIDYRFGLKESLVRWWTPAGELIGSGVYRDGEAYSGIEMDTSDDMFSYFQLYTYKDGKKHGEYRGYDGQWRLVARALYENDRLIEGISIITQQPEQLDRPSDCPTGNEVSEFDYGRDGSSITDPEEIRAMREEWLCPVAMPMGGVTVTTGGLVQ